MSIELIVFLIAVVLILAAYFFFIRPALNRAPQSMDDFQPTDNLNCQRVHQQFWIPAGQFPVSNDKGGYDFINVFECPVCLKHEDTTERLKARVRFETITNGRHIDELTS